MFTTASESEANTTTRLIRAMDRQHPVTITYLKEEKDAADKKTGSLVATVRTIEIYDIRITKAGHTLLVAMDRESQERRTFRLDRLVSYTVHRTAYTVPRDTDTTVRPLTAQPVAATPLTTAPIAIRIDVLAAQLAA